MGAVHFPTPQPSTNRSDEPQVATCLSHAEPRRPSAGGRPACGGEARRYRDSCPLSCPRTVANQRGGEAAAESRFEDVAQGIPQHVEDVDGESDGLAWPEGQPWVARMYRLPSMAD
jgi:hypothetical protein